MPSSSPRLSFSRAQRLTHALEYQRAYHGNVRKHAGPLVVFAHESGLQRPRLGLAVSRHVGNAVKRSLIKRRIREAFRLSQQDLPAIDLVVRVRPHAALSVEEYRSWLVGAAKRLDGRLGRDASDEMSA